MRIAVVSSSAFPASPNFYGSEVMNAVLADKLGEMGHKVTLFATPKTIEGKYRLRLIPTAHGKANFFVESLVYEDEENREILLNSDYVIDASATCYTTESLYQRHRDVLYKDLVAVYFRNGTAFNSPRPPAHRHVHGIALSKIAREIAIKQWGIPEDKIHYIYYGVDMDLYAFKKDKEDYVLYLGRPHWHKGLHRLLTIAKKVPDQRFILAWRALTDEHKRYEKIEITCMCFDNPRHLI